MRPIGIWVLASKMAYRLTGLFSTNAYICITKFTDFPAHSRYCSMAPRRMVERPWVNFQSIGRVRSKLPN